MIYAKRGTIGSTGSKNQEDEEEEENVMLARQALANNKLVGDKSDEENNLVDVVGTIIN